MDILLDLSKTTFMVMWALSGVVGLLALITPAAFEAVCALGNRVVVQGVNVRGDEYWIDADKFVFAHSRIFGAVVLATTGYLAFISRHGPEAYSKSTLLAVVAVALLMGIVALRSIVLQSRRIDSHFAEAHADPLTGLANRRAFEREISRRLMHKSRPLCLLIMDVDDFKGVNDKFGHVFGDSVLREIASTLQATARDDEFIARLGGDEFAMLLVNTPLKEASARAEQFRAAIRQIRHHHEGRVVPLSVSIGVADAQREDNPISLYKRSDAALYAAKESGRDCSFQFGGPERTSDTKSQSGIAGDQQV